MLPCDTPQHIDEWNQAGRHQLPGHLGLTFVDVSGERVVGYFDVLAQHLAWNGFLHAASVIALADTACGYGTVASLPSKADSFTTVELKSNFVGTATQGRVNVIAEALHQGRTTQVWSATVTRADDDKAIAHFRCTQLILRDS